MQYMGSKSRFSKYIVPIIQQAIDENNIKSYYELFVGGANIIDKIKCEKRVGNDINKYLIALLIHARDSDLSNLPSSILFDEYSKVRDSYNKKDNTYEDWYKGFIGFCGSYGCRFFDGGYMRANKEDTTGIRTQSAIKNLIVQAPKLEGIDFVQGDYKEFKGKIHNSVVYLDPPYRNTKKYKTTDIDYDDFYQFCKDLKADGNIVFISEYNLPEEFICIWEKETKTTIDRNAKDRDITRIERLYTI